jgi:hypothetical protein
MNIKDLEDDSVYEMIIDGEVKMASNGSFIKVMMTHPKVIETYRQQGSSMKDETSVVFRKMEV